MKRALLLGPLLPLLACGAPSSPSPHGYGDADSSAAAPPPPSASQASSPAQSSPPSNAQQSACRSTRVDEGCRAGAPKRPARRTARTPAPIRHATDDELFSTNGKTVFYYRQKTEFDLGSFSYAAVTDCPLWEGVFAWDKHDVYVLEPQSCGGENCSGDYTGYSWGPIGVRTPAAFHWLPGGYGTDGHFVYNRWHEGPLDEARPESFQVLLCGTERDGFVVGQDGDHFYRDGKAVTKVEAFAPPT